MRVAANDNFKMWNQISANRLTNEREKVKVTALKPLTLPQDHVMHIERLRRAQPTLHIAPPKKPQHLKQNLKKELNNLGKLPCFLPVLQNA